MQPDWSGAVYRPVPHSLHSAAPTVAYFPEGHPAQEMSEERYVPVGQRAHCAEPGSLAVLPEVQEMQDAIPVAGAIMFIAHDTQSERDVAPAFALARPTGHGRQSFSALLAPNPG